MTELNVDIRIDEEGQRPMLLSTGTVVRGEYRIPKNYNKDNSNM